MLLLSWSLCAAEDRDPYRNESGERRRGSVCHWRCHAISETKQFPGFYPSKLESQEGVPDVYDYRMDCLWANRGGNCQVDHAWEGSRWMHSYDPAWDCRIDHRRIHRSVRLRVRQRR